MIVGWIIGAGADDAGLCSSDVNTDGVVNITDVVAIVGSIIGGRADLEDDATNADVILSDNNISIHANGYIAGVQMTISHGNNFSIDLTDAYIAEYLTQDNITKLALLFTPKSVIGCALSHILLAKHIFLF